MELKMTTASSDPVQTLDLNDNVIDTGPMGDCVSVIVLANPVGGKYQLGRGSHGGGGIENVNFAGLFTNIPNNPQTRIIMISGTLNYSPYRMGQNEAYLQERVAQHRLNSAQTQFVHNVPQGSVNRQGQIS